MLPIFNDQKTILIYCEESGAFAELYRRAGYNVIVRDLQLNKDHDIVLQKYLDLDIYGFICFPPCDHFARSGAMHWKRKGVEKLKEALALMDACLRIVALKKPVFWMLENPIGRIKDYLGEPRLKFDPWQYGEYLGPGMEAYTKRTWLWGNFNVPKKRPVKVEIEKDVTTKRRSGSVQRSKSPLGFAKAFYLVNQ